MNRSQHTGQICELRVDSLRTGLAAAFLAAAGTIAAEHDAQADDFFIGWGQNAYGLCTPPADLGSCSSIAAGFLHSMAIKSDGTLLCWGAGTTNAGSGYDYGQSIIPSELGPCSSISAGGIHSMALCNNGTVRCWGAGTTNTGAYPNYGQSIVPPDLGPCSSIAAGFSHSMAIRTDRTVLCWGAGTTNAGANYDYGQSIIPAELGPCSSIAAGGLHSIAIRIDGTVRCWGAGTTSSGSWPNFGQSIVPADLGPCTRIAAGAFHSIALRSNGVVRCWGAGTNPGSSPSNNAYGQSTVPADLGPCSGIAAGGWHSIAIRNDGSVRCWGDNFAGQCNVSSLPRDFTSVAGGRAYSIAIQNRITCDGDLNQDNQLNGADLGVLLGQWGTSGGTTGADLNHDGTANGADLGLMLGAWGSCALAVPSWATLIEAQPDPLVVTDAAIRAAITTSGLAWRVRDTATQMEMLLVPPGIFTMGCTASNAYACGSAESPTHQVTLTEAFYLGRYEVTQAQWVAKMGSNPSVFQGASYPDAANRPVEKMSWLGVHGYLSATGMRLPSEAEWEYACRAGTTTAFSNGSSDDATVGNIAWYSANSNSQTHIVGGKAANALGLHDMSGNVAELVNDYYSSTYYSTTSSINPFGPNDSVQQGNGLRGGNYSAPTEELRSSWRGRHSGGGFGVGFRVARIP
jgi:formylglycine-generating enzyme required for sulfatase activity/alpha-tubulin suppressor-like RCC1 family protein